MQNELVKKLGMSLTDCHLRMKLFLKDIIDKNLPASENSMVLSQGIKVQRHCWAHWLETNKNASRKAHVPLGEGMEIEKWESSFPLNSTKFRFSNTTVAHCVIILLSQ